jgi:hypothetical protein
MKILTGGKAMPRENEIVKPDPEIQKVIDHWNITGISKTGQSKAVINSIRIALKKFGIKNLFIALDRYNTMYSDKNYFFNYKYIPSVFYTGRIQKFLDGGSLWESYLHSKNTKSLPVVEYFELPEYDKAIQILKSMKYEDYLHTRHWKWFAKEACDNANHTCQLCNATDTGLNVHHKTYRNRGHETFNDVIVLCSDCHKKVHGFALTDTIQPVRNML